MGIWRDGLSLVMGARVQETRRTRFPTVVKGAKYKSSLQSSLFFSSGLIGTSIASLSPATTPLTLLSSLLSFAAASSADMALRMASSSRASPAIGVVLSWAGAGAGAGALYLRDRVYAFSGSTVWRYWREKGKSYCSSVLCPIQYESCLPPTASLSQSDIIVMMYVVMGRHYTDP